ncbi:MAG: universal stress protein [Methanofollis liminatans]|jgi:nucleotide-binding universal stress UspA family protein|uniref:UspA domain-containing protein n=2 Tax=Methanofollis liminatans TaxID=2201 RepID=J1L2Q2_9EURY|nr:universal stress protein [Methanofollis liminatans]EJG06970.1 UspA domain-containing protein [Methanofollis liminatans DSM 4140]MDD3110758.1 universal stress protein [Methanofollis liminatans]HDS62541.1 universal stress protein [Methanofollis liminatans]
MFKKIVVAIDGSDISLKALEVALSEARIWNAELHVIYVVETSMFSSIPMDNTWEIIYSLLESEGKEVFQKSKERAAQDGVSLITHLKDGHAGNEIVSLTEELHADLIVIGSRGKTNIDRLLLGSVSEHVVRNSSCTTMVVR